MMQRVWKPEEMGGEKHFSTSLEPFVPALSSEPNLSTFNKGWEGILSKKMKTILELSSWKKEEQYFYQICQKDDKASQV